MLILGMAFPNMIGLYFLCGNVKRHLKEYQQDLKSGDFTKSSKRGKHAGD